MKKIKIGEPQPVACKNCEELEGYQYSDYLKIHYTTVHEANGSHEMGFYGDSSKVLNAGITPYCSNCGERLDFKLIRGDKEILKSFKTPNNKL